MTEFPRLYGLWIKIELESLLHILLRFFSEQTFSWCSAPPSFELLDSNQMFTVTPGGFNEQILGCSLEFQ